jgi:2-oxoglutarate dehydrogenase complex dehydrogenase (E1) component-like enzyme
MHASDMAKAIDSPVIHVNGDSVDNCIRASKLALAYWYMFRKDVFVNLLCYRKHGHNELDEPTFTNPCT